MAPPPRAVAPEKDPDCEDPICSDTKKMLSMALGDGFSFGGAKLDKPSSQQAGAGGQSGGPQGIPRGAAEGAAVVAAAAPPRGAAEGAAIVAEAAAAAAGAIAANEAAAIEAGAGGVGGGLPLNKNEVGDATWALLHSAAAYYPDKPSEEEQREAKNFITGLASMYPCGYCREDFKKEVKKSPPSVESRLALSLWVCQQHNIVNKKLGAKTIECEIGLLDKRWRNKR